MKELEYLRKYSKDVSLVDFSQLSEEIISTFPDYSIRMLSTSNQILQHEILFDEWAKYDYQFQSTLNYLKFNLVGIELILNKGKYSLLYAVKNTLGNTVFYEGRNPYTKELPYHINGLWQLIPKTFTDWYDKMHNGWVYFASQSNGILPVEDIVVLGDLDWGILEEIDAESLPFKLDNCLGLFNNGMGDYASIDLNCEDKKMGFIWWHTKSPKLNVEIWPIIDEWTKIGIEK